MRIKSFIIFTVFFLALLSQSSCKKDAMVKSGDIVFRANTQNELSKAINSVTSSDLNYSHMGICLVEDDDVWVIHSAPKLGVVKQSLNEFMSPDSINLYSTDLYRFNSGQSENAALCAVEALKYVGQEYNKSYVIEDDGYYCSELIYTLFESYGVFKLNPMTFKDVGSSEFNKVWVEYYNELNVPIPEGKLGCNPNQMSQNENLNFVRHLQ